MARRGRPPHPDVLTPREWEVLALVREGLLNPGIAERLGLRGSTVKHHVSQIIAKLGVQTREEAAAWRPEAAAAGKPRLREIRPPRGPLRLLQPLTLAKAVGVAASLAAVAGLGVLIWGLLGTGGEASDTSLDQRAAGSPSASASVPQLPAFSRTVPQGLAESFLSNSVGWIGVDESILFTEDGGRHWDQIARFDNPVHRLK